ncbi:MAG: 7TM diverse intracellular signaling domain-containing protein, partial [Flavobacteriaceae bacterium]
MTLYSALLFSGVIQNTENLFEFPYQSGFLDFVIGGLTLLSAYHVFLYFQNKNKSYLFYSLYLFFIILSQVQYVHSGFLKSIIRPFGVWPEYGELYTETYYFIYFLFAFHFLDIKEDFPRWNKYIIKALYIIGVFCVLKFIYYLFSGDYSPVRNGYYVFVIYILILSIFLYILFFKSPNSLKFYMIIGSLILLVFSVLSLLLYLDYLGKGLSPEPAYSYLYIGYVLENFIFSLGLGKKQKFILNERNEVHSQLIDQLEENEKLQLEVRKKLEQDVELLNAKLEKDQLERLNIQYERDLVELKLASLRSQMNPHFIFNSLNSIKGFIIDNEQENAVFY